MKILKLLGDLYFGAFLVLFECVIRVCCVALFLLAFTPLGSVLLVVLYLLDKRCAKEIVKEILEFF